MTVAGSIPGPVFLIVETLAVAAKADSARPLGNSILDVPDKLPGERASATPEASRVPGIVVANFQRSRPSERTVGTLAALDYLTARPGELSRVGAGSLQRLETVAGNPLENIETHRNPLAM